MLEHELRSGHSIVVVAIDLIHLLSPSRHQERREDLVPNIKPNWILLCLRTLDRGQSLFKHVLDLEVIPSLLGGLFHLHESVVMRHLGNLILTWRLMKTRLHLIQLIHIIIKVPLNTGLSKILENQSYIFLKRLR